VALRRFPRIDRLVLARVTRVPEWHPEHGSFEPWKPLSRVGFFLFAETLRAVRPSATTPAGLQSLIAVLYEPPRAQRFGRYDQRCP
jgi:hypothetical protein